MARRCGIETQPQQVGAAVVADAVHHSFAFGDQGAIEFGDGQTLPVRQRPGQVAALRADHRCVATPLKGFMQGDVRGDRGVIGRIEPGRGTDHKAARLEGVVPQCHRRLFAEDGPDQRTRELGAVDLLPLAHQGEAGQRVVVLPAGQGSDAADGRGHHLESGTIALAPHHPLVIGGGDLAAFEHHLAIGIDQQLGVVEAAAVTFVDPQQHVHPVSTSGVGDAVELGARDDHGLLIELEMRAAHQHSRLDEGKVGVVGQIRLRKDDQLHPGAGGFGHGRQQPLERSRQRAQNRTDLSGSNDNGGFHGQLKDGRKGLNMR